MLIRSVWPSKLKYFKKIMSVSVRTTSSDSTDVIFEEIQDKGIITLNRPKALNALNLSMVEKILPVLKKWEKEKTCVIVKSAGEKAFCSGGDVKTIIVEGLKGGKLGHKFFRREYIMNGVIGTYAKPYIAFIDGYVMGGGVGLSVHGLYRVATERTLFAMPETQIGLFPDVGGSYFLPRLEGKLGWYLGLTGYRLKGIDVLKAGIATHFCESSKLPDLLRELVDCNKDDIKKTLDKYSELDSKDFVLAPYLAQINHCFAGDTIEEIVKRLEADKSQWATETLNTLRKMSPTSLKITNKELQLGSNLDLLQCLQIEYRLAVGCLTHKDFYEGVRALLIDKDQNPKWKPATIEEVSNTIVDEHFKKLPEDQELKHKL